MARSVQNKKTSTPDKKKEHTDHDTKKAGDTNISPQPAPDEYTTDISDISDEELDGATMIDDADKYLDVGQREINLIGEYLHKFFNDYPDKMEFLSSLSDYMLSNKISTDSISEIIITLINVSDPEFIKIKSTDMKKSYIERKKKEKKLLKDIGLYDENKNVEKSAIVFKKILSKSRGRNEATKTMINIEDVLGVNGKYSPMFRLWDPSTGTGVLIDPSVYEVSLAKEMGERRQRTVINAVPLDIAINRDPLTNKELFRIVWKSRGWERFETVGTLPDIGKALSEGYVEYKSQLNDVLRAVVTAFDDHNKIRKTKEVSTPGYYMFDGKLIPVNVDTEMPEVKDLQYALQKMNNLAEFYERSANNWSGLMFLAVMMPFGYIFKQMNGKQNYIRYPFLFGDINTGKSHLMDIMLHLNGVPERTLSGGDIDTKTKIGKYYSQSTFPTAVDEGVTQFAFQKRVVPEIFKRGAESLFVRTDYDLGNAPIPAYTVFMFANNYAPPNIPGLIKRIILFNFTGAVNTDRDVVNEFEFEFGDVDKLSVIHPAVYNILKDNLDAFKKSPLTLGKLVWKKLYKMSGLEIPKWVTHNFVEEKIDVSMNIKEAYTSWLRESVMVAYTRFYHRAEGEDFTTMLHTVLSNRLIPGLHTKQIYSKRYFIMTQQTDDEIGRDVRFQEAPATLKGWASLLGAEYKTVYLGENNVKALRMPYTALEELLNPDIDMDDPDAHTAIHEYETTEAGA